MTDLSIDQWLNGAASMLAVLACGTFAGVYHYKAPWWRSNIGRNLMGFAGAVGLLSLYTVLVTLWPDGPFAVIARGIRTALILAIATLMAQRTRLLIAAQREHRTTNTAKDRP